MTPNFTDTHSLSGAFLANKLERLISLISQQGGEILNDQGVLVPPQSLSCFLMVGETGRISAAEIASQLQQPHQLATQRIEGLLKRGLIARTTDPEDNRRKLVHLTSEGEVQYKRLCDVLRQIAHVFSDLFEELAVDLLKTTDATLQALHDRPLFQRFCAINSKETS